MGEVPGQRGLSCLLSVFQTLPDGDPPRKNWVSNQQRNDRTQHSEAGLITMPIFALTFWEIKLVAENQ